MKKRIVTIALVVALMATCFAGTYAYLKDDEAQVNTFTTGRGMEPSAFGLMLSSRLPPLAAHS